jgi:hypothetical protein
VWRTNQERRQVGRPNVVDDEEQLPITDDPREVEAGLFRIGQGRPHPVQVEAQSEISSTSRAGVQSSPVSTHRISGNRSRIRAS